MFIKKISIGNFKWFSEIAYGINVGFFINKKRKNNLIIILFFLFT